MAPMCPHGRAYWRHLANTIEFVLILAKPSPQPKRQIDQFSHFCTAYGRVWSGMPGHVHSPNNCPFAWGSGPHLIHASLGPPESITQTASRSVQPFMQFTSECRQACRGMSFPLKIAPPHGGSGPHLIHDSLGPSKPITQRASRSV